MALRRAGCKLIIVVRRGDRLEALAGELKAKYSGGFCLVLDMMDIEKSKGWTNCFPVPNVDILVNNAGQLRSSVEENVMWTSCG